MKIPTLKTKKTIESLKKLPRFLGRHAFLTFLGLLLLSLVLGSFIFYQYSILAAKEKPEVIEKPLQFKEETYQEVLKIWQVRQTRFEQANLKEHLNPFQEIKKELPELKEEKPAKETNSELPTVPEIKELQAATTLYNFYMIKGEKLPPPSERAKIWEEKGLGSAEEYFGSHYQNIKLLEELKKELTG